MTPATPPAGVRFTPVPDPFIKAAMLGIDDLDELKASLYIMWKLHQKKGYPIFVTLDELLADDTLTRGLSRRELPGDEALRLALSRALARGTLIRVSLIKENNRYEVYMLNTEASRKAVRRIELGKTDLGRTIPRAAGPAMAEPPAIFKLYAENIGLLTPLLADDLREAERLYPPSWIEDAFGEAVALNKRNWRYISRILENWAKEGKGRGKPGRYP